MSATTFQTVRLRRGRHASPADGACVMELASMIAGEPFSDHPRCVSPVIAAFLRSYNDLADDVRRQDLYRYASAAVGTREGDDVEEARLRCCVAALAELTRARSRSLLWRMRSRSPSHLYAWLDCDGATSRAAEAFLNRLARVLAAGGDEGHAWMLVLMDRLLLIRSTAPEVRTTADAVIGATARARG